MSVDEKDTMITIKVKFNGKLLPVSLPADSKTGHLKTLLQSMTNVLPRGQKIIFKGKVLTNDMTLKDADVGDGARVMLMATQGLHQGAAPPMEEARTGLIRSTVGRGENTQVNIKEGSATRWEVTGIIGLSASHLKAIPEEVWKCGTHAKVLDLNHNSIQQVPRQINCLTSLRKLLLNANGLSDDSIDWDALSSLKFLTVLCLSENRLTTLPPALGALVSLEQLNISRNNITTLPAEIGLLHSIEIFNADHNRISSIPYTIGDCVQLREVDLSFNHLSEIPETFSTMQYLTALRLANNGLKTLPTAIFKRCLQLSTLDLHNTEITLEVLRQLEGWDVFDERRRAKHQKQLDFRVANSGQFDEGADKDW